jgi:hypothetical protein
MQMKLLSFLILQIGNLSVYEGDKNVCQQVNDDDDDDDD